MSTESPPAHALRSLLVAIVGRSNVGKSTLFNRLVGRRQAIVSPLRGTTRDRLYGHTEWRDVRLTLIDTGGVEFPPGDGLSQAVQRHIRLALAEADGCILLCDARDGLLPADEMIMDELRRMGKPVVLGVNKADHRLEVPPEFFSLGIEQPIALSAMHGRGIGELLDAVRSRLMSGDARESAWPLADDSRSGVLETVAIVGRQNVGKSSLMNALLRTDRVIVSDAPGTTRDAIETRLLIGGEPITLIDTAGLRHRRKVRSPVDVFSMSRAFEAIQRCGVALVVLDATQGMTSDDRRILSRVCTPGRGLVIAVNKWDVVKPGSARQLTQVMQRAVPAVSFAPVLAVSAKTGFHLPQMVTTIRSVIRAMRRGLSTDECRSLLQEAWRAQPPPRVRGRMIHLQDARWCAGIPARVELRTRPMTHLPVPYQRYLLKRFHAHPKLPGVPIRLVVTPLPSE